MGTILWIQTWAHRGALMRECNFLDLSCSSVGPWSTMASSGLLVSVMQIYQCLLRHRLGRHRGTKAWMTGSFLLMAPQQRHPKHLLPCLQIMLMHCKFVS